MDQKSFISIVIPVFNEEANLDELISRCLITCDEMKKPYEIIFVDDGSSDASVDKITQTSKQHPNKIVGVLLNRNYGQHAAVMAGFAHTKGEIVITLDADLQNPPEAIPQLVDKLQEGFDVVAGVRVPRCDSIFRRLSSFIINKTVQKSTGVIMHDYGCMQRAYHRKIIDAMLKCHEHSTFIPILANTFAHKTAEIDIQHEKRSMGTSKYGFMKLINLMFDLLTSMTTFPLRLLSIIGGLISAFGFTLAVYIIVMRIIYGTAWAAGGVFTLFAILFVFVGAQFIGMGLLGEYIGRIYSDVRARPQYFVQKVVGRTA